ncbi:DEHA2E05962p [Debaryomyces hansenii CBS767]|uniref:DEHA2E05962p n=1 Tax=Debaryomyces hansenii (strain ATCC 36239 / CBS 767 / BCRC 21394 / JCM 1990 / NBRC 0083 / IGC 2968) TaxID=284592 RepID=Q6BQD8_DEBHA|nr:DEHA2E05962p [Debaryomyces hansenii CBS767]CAG87809.1 DEHA2E05962p [Debaryomyces hansenii CBS767]|eukprot:XP_459582.1 DEHA2E05962p [Debaryomyces hansenii CBS767]
MIKATKTKAIPIAAPPNHNVAIEAPMYLAANANCTIIKFI